MNVKPDEKYVSMLELGKPQMKPENYLDLEAGTSLRLKKATLHTEYGDLEAEIISYEMCSDGNVEVRFRIKGTKPGMTIDGHAEVHKESTALSDSEIRSPKRLLKD